MPATAERAKRIDTYREKSRFCWLPPTKIFKTNEAMNLLQEYHRIAADAGDEDYGYFSKLNFVTVQHPTCLLRLSLWKD